MTLRRKMIYQIGAMIVGLMLVSFAALYGLNGLQADFGIALGGYRELREVYDVGLNIATAKKSLIGDRPDPARAANELDAALAKFDRFLAGPGESLAQNSEGVRLETALRSSLREAVKSVHLPPDDAFYPAGNRFGSVDRALSQVAAIGAEIQQMIAAREAAGRTKWRATFTIVTAVSSVIIGGAVLLGIYQYRSVIFPLKRLSEAARKLTAGQFGNRVEVRGPREFAALAADFNHMATELDTVYRDLEAKVAAKSNELARSERLASVGYLAAGVAHEINNPLSIITGYGERALQHLDLGEGESMLVAIEKCLRVMCEEAYRCKTITDQLLSLARPSHEARNPVDLLQIARAVQSAVDGLEEYQDRTLTIEAGPGSENAVVLASEGELKQVLLNLVINALEAVPADGGCVTIRVESSGLSVSLTVTDNGRGMSPATLERIFEPFYTEKRGSHRAGTGLGLSIAHAIVRSHGGTLEAFSAGPGTGSQFLITLPRQQAGGSM